jgi:serine/threonine-protein kinase
MTSSPALLSDPFLGSVIDDKYRIEHKLGEGGIGLVYQATHLTLNHPVAVKVLRLDQGHTGESAERLAREARTMARLDSPHIVDVVDFGYLPSGHPFLVLEYLTGETLAARLDRCGPFSLERACRYMQQAILGLAEAHRKGVVHRDLKPDNLYLTTAPGGDEQIKLLDFGISKHERPGLSKLTRPHVSLGSPQYMAPEQVLAEEVDARADIWALGVVLYELTTGVLPFDGVSLAEVCARVVQTNPVPPSRHNPNLPKAFDELVLKCLQKSPSARHSDVMSVAQALDRSVRVPPRSSALEVTRQATRPRPRPLHWWALGSLVGALAVAQTAGALAPSAPRAVASQAPLRQHARASQVRAAERQAPARRVTVPTRPIPAHARPLPAPERVPPPGALSDGATRRAAPAERRPAASSVPPADASTPWATPPAAQEPSPLPEFGGRS